MSNVWSKLACGIKPYVPGEQPKMGGLVKLNTNENPYPPSQRVREAISAVKPMRLALYPDPESRSLREAIAKVHDVDAREVFVGNGSDEVLGLCFPAYFDAGRPIRFADITYSFYPVYASLFGMDVETVRLNDDFSLPIERYFDAPGGVIIANPNAPTGMAVSLEQIKSVLKSNGRAVIVDEAYCEFGAESAIPLVRKHENLVVVRTLSKSHSLAGLRVGYAIGNAHTLEALHRVKNSFNSYPLDALAQAGARAALMDTEYLERTRNRIIATRGRTVKRLREMGFDCPDSCANFVFARHPGFSGREIQARLREGGVIVRRFDIERISDHLRITIGTDEQMERLFSALETIVGL